MRDNASIMAIRLRMKGNMDPSLRFGIARKATYDLSFRIAVRNRVCFFSSHM
jgi:hypothetical protein